MQQLYVLHSRPYRDTSLLLQCLSEKAGLIDLVARGAKRPKSPLRPVLNLFTPLQADWFGLGELKTLKMAEPLRTGVILKGDQLLKGFYLNELLIKVLHKHDPCPEIFQLYSHVLSSALTEADLRRFEINLLKELGYALQFHVTADAEQPIEESGEYYFESGVGFLPCVNDKWPGSIYFAGVHLLAMAKNNFTDPDVLRAAKRLLRLAFQPMMGSEGLKSRELFMTQL